MMGLVSVGDSKYSGKYKNIFCAGQTLIDDSNVNRIFGAGEIDINNSNIKKINCAGQINSTKSEFQNINCAGQINFNKCCCKEKCIIYGEVNVDYFECEVLRNCGIKSNTKTNPEIVKWSGEFIAKTFENCHKFNLDFTYKFENIISYKRLSSNKEVACQNFYSFSELDLNDINAENVNIITGPNVYVKNIFGTNINIVNEFKPDKYY